MLSSDWAINLTSEIFAYFDNAVIDSQPTLSAADTPLLERALAGRVLSAEAAGVAPRRIKQSLVCLYGVHANVVGIPLTKLTQKNAGYGWGIGYGDQDIGAKLSTWRPRTLRSYRRSWNFTSACGNGNAPSPSATTT